MANSDPRPSEPGCGAFYMRSRGWGPRGGAEGAKKRSLISARIGLTPEG